MLWNLSTKLLKNATHKNCYYWSIETYKQQHNFEFNRYQVQLEEQGKLQYFTNLDKPNEEGTVTNISIDELLQENAELKIRITRLQSQLGGEQPHAITPNNPTINQEMPGPDKSLINLLEEERYRRAVISHY